MSTISKNLLLRCNIGKLLEDILKQKKRENRKKENFRSTKPEKQFRRMMGNVTYSPHLAQNKGDRQRDVEEKSLGNHKVSDMLSHLEYVICRHLTDPLKDMRKK